MQIKWLRKALTNLDEEAEYIAREDPAMASVIVQQIHEAVSLLAKNPSLGRPGRIFGTRELVIPGTRYLVPYRVRPRLKHVEVLRVFHTSRKPPEHW
jgi:toxin ParE1/3/4